MSRLDEIKDLLEAERKRSEAFAGIADMWKAQAETASRDLALARGRIAELEKEQAAYLAALSEIDHEVKDNTLSLEPDGDYYKQDLAEAHRICDRVAEIVDRAIPDPPAIRSGGVTNVQSR